MPNFARITIAGHLGSDPETRNAGSTTVTSFSVAVNTGFGERECCTWYRPSIWGKRGETAAQHLKKGDPVIISGEPQNRPYEKDGEKRFSLEIGNADWTFAGAKSDSGQSRTNASNSPTLDFEPDSEIPF